MWSVLAALHPVSYLDHPYRYEKYIQFQDELDFSGIDFPVKIDQISKFERQNSISINIFGYEEKNIFPRYLSPEKYEKHIDLLLFSRGSVNHYCLIKDLDKFLSSQSKHHGQMFRCHFCLHGFIRKNLLEEHLPHCGKHGAQAVSFPSEDDNILKFQEYAKQLKVPFAIYADFESITSKIDTVSPDSSSSYTEKYQHHQPCGFSYVIVSEAEEYCMPPVVYRGHDAVDNF